MDITCDHDASSDPSTSGNFDVHMFDQGPRPMIVPSPNREFVAPWDQSTLPSVRGIHIDKDNNITVTLKFEHIA